MLKKILCLFVTVLLLFVVSCNDLSDNYDIIDSATQTDDITSGNITSVPNSTTNAPNYTTDVPKDSNAGIQYPDSTYAPPISTDKKVLDCTVLPDDQKDVVFAKQIVQKNNNGIAVLRDSIIAELGDYTKFDFGLFAYGWYLSNNTYLLFDDVVYPDSYWITGPAADDVVYARQILRRMESGESVSGDEIKSVLGDYVVTGSGIVERNWKLSDGTYLTYFDYYPRSCSIHGETEDLIVARQIVARSQAGEVVPYEEVIELLGSWTRVTRYEVSLGWRIRDAFSNDYYLICYHEREPFKYFITDIKPERWANDNNMSPP